MEKIQSVRGTIDLFPKEMRTQSWVINTAREVAILFGFEEVSLPILEKTEVFSRPLGQSSDVVSKETYTFEDRGGDSLTLRPEGTAGIMRAIIQSGKCNEIPLKLFYSGPMFRYERPQKGRLRQFNQIGVELLGISEPIADVEVILCGVKYLKKLGVLDKCVLNINTLGDTESRLIYRESLVKYFNKNISSLSPISKERLNSNPLRILDSKEDLDQEIIKKAPLFSSYLNDISKRHFEAVLEYLKLLDVKYKHNEKLVRGLDYYCHTTFEFITTELGSQGTVLGGGRYDGLSKTLNGPSLPGVGFAAGVERLSMLSVKNLKRSEIIGIIPIEENYTLDAYKIMNNLRDREIASEIYTSGNIGKSIKKVLKREGNYIVLVGGDEFKKGFVVLRNLINSNQFNVATENLVDEISKIVK